MPGGTDIPNGNYTEDQYIGGNVMTESSFIRDKDGVLTRTRGDGHVLVAPVINIIRINDVICFSIANGDDIYVRDMTSLIESDEVTGSITFTHEGDTYSVRDLQEEDGYWLSSFNIALPLEALGRTLEAMLPLKLGLAFGRTQAQLHPPEGLFVHCSKAEAFVLALVYRFGKTEWYRGNHDWIKADEYTTANPDPEIEIVGIDPGRGAELVALFDTGPVKVKTVMRLRNPFMVSKPGDLLKGPLEYSASSIPGSFSPTYHLSLVTPEKDYQQISNDGLSQAEARRQYSEAIKLIAAQSKWVYSGFMLMVLEDQSGMSVAYESF